MQNYYLILPAAPTPKLISPNINIKEYIKKCEEKFFSEELTQESNQTLPIYSNEKEALQYANEQRPIVICVEAETKMDSTPKNLSDLQSLKIISYRNYKECKSATESKIFYFGITQEKRLLYTGLWPMYAQKTDEVIQNESKEHFYKALKQVVQEKEKLALFPSKEAVLKRMQELKINSNYYFPIIACCRMSAEEYLEKVIYEEETQKESMLMTDTVSIESLMVMDKYPKTEVFLEIELIKKSLIQSKPSELPSALGILVCKALIQNLKEVFGNNYKAQMTQEHIQQLQLVVMNTCEKNTNLLNGIQVEKSVIYRAITEFFQLFTVAEVRCWLTDEKGRLKKQIENNSKNFQHSPKLFRGVHNKSEEKIYIERVIPRKETLPDDQISELVIAHIKEWDLEQQINRVDKIPEEYNYPIFPNRCVVVSLELKRNTNEELYVNKATAFYREQCNSEEIRKIQFEVLEMARVPNLHEEQRLNRLALYYQYDTIRDRLLELVQEEDVKIIGPYIKKIELSTEAIYPKEELTIELSSNK